MSAAVNKILKLLDPKEREIVFWNYYKKSQYLDHVTVKHAFYNWFRRTILSYSSEYEVSPEKRSEESFWLHFLHRSTSFIIIIHAINVFLLCVIMITTIFIMGYTTKYIEHYDMANISYVSLLPDIVLWLFISSLCMYFLVIFSNEKNMAIDNNIILPRNRYKAWMITGYFIVISRFLLLIYMYTSSNILNKSTNTFDYSSCEVPERLSADDKTIAIPFMRVLLDTGQVVLFSTVPFPHPFSLLFVITEIGIQNLRIFGCSERIPPTFASFRIFFVTTIIFIYLYVMLSSLAIQRGSKNNYSMLMALSELGNDKFQFIKLLCEEVKVPLELINNSLEFIKSEKILADDGIENHKEVIAIQLQVYTINLLTDNILFLSTTHEGRFEFKSELVNVMYLLQKSMKPILAPSDISTYIKCEDKSTTHQLYYSAQLMLIFIKNIVYIVAFTIEYIKLKNKISLVNTISSNKSINENKIMITLKSEKNSTILDSINSKVHKPNTEQEYTMQNKNTEYHFEISIKFPIVDFDSFTHSTSINSSGREFDSSGFNMMKSLSKLLCAIHGNGYHETKNSLIFSFPNFTKSKILNDANNADNVEVKTPGVTSVDNDETNNECYNCSICVVQSADSVPVALLQSLQSLKVKVLNIICDDTKKLARMESSKIIKQCDVVMIQQIEYYDLIRNYLQYQGKIIYYGIMDVITHSTNITFDHTVYYPIDSIQIGLLDTYLRRLTQPKNELTNDISNDAYFGENKKKSISHYIYKTLTSCLNFAGNFPKIAESKSNSSEHIQDDKAAPVNVFAPCSFAKHTDFGLRVFTDEIERSYLKWNIINTSESIMHPAATIDGSFLLMVIYHTLGVTGNVIFGGRQLYPTLSIWGQLFLGFWAVFIYVMIYCRKYIIFNYLEPNDGSITLYWKLTLNWLYVANIGSTLLAVFDASIRAIRSGDTINYSGSINDYMSIEKVFFTRIGSFYGITAISNLLISVAFTINLWAFKFVWPHSIIYLISLTAKWVIFSTLYLYRPLQPKLFMLYISAFLPFYVTNFCVTFHFEESHRTEFIRFREAIFNYVFMENIMDIFQTNVKTPINSLSITRRSFLESIKNRILTMKWTKLSRSNVRNIFDTFTISTYNLETLQHKLNFQYHLVSSFNTGGKKSSVIGIEDTKSTTGRFESFTTSLVVDSLISLLSSMHSEIISGDIKVFTHVDTGLSLIKLNKILFITVLMNAFNTAIINIKRRLRADRYSPKVVQELVIIVKENLKKSTTNFNDFRPLEIEVIDTGILSEFHLHSKFEQQMLSCDMENNSYKSFERVTGMNERVNVQLITVHYKYILNITEKVNSIIPKKQQYLQAIDNQTFRRYLFDAYDTFVTSNISNRYISSGKNKVASNMMGVDKKIDEIVVNTVKTNVRTMVLFQQLGDYSEDTKNSGNTETNSVQVAFERSGWIVKVVSSFSLFYPESEWLTIADCILIQYDEHNDYYSSNRKDLLVSYAAQLRLMGYKLAIMGLLPVKKEKVKTHYKNNIAFLDNLDHIIVRPILQSTIDEVNLKCDTRIIDSLLSLNLYLSND